MLGKTLLHYEILAPIGKGGMGEVFSARDSKLGRDVAIKVLPAELAGDPEREARLQREARALASLQHPNVASIYGFEEADGIRFLVMELVLGEDLSERMKQGPLPLGEVTDIGGQIAAGLEAAHESGIVHRDLKPANVKITPDGQVKILDFGLAQAWLGDPAADASSSLTPTITAAMTRAGAVLGTAAYMSPEQARGGSVDRRTDIWAFGVILYEMLTGTRLFQGETISDTLAAVLRAEPDWQALPTSQAPALCRLINRCLERNPRLRLRDIGEARIFLQGGETSGVDLGFSQFDLGTAADRSGPAVAPRRVPVLALVVLAIVCTAAGAWLGWRVLAAPEPAPILHTVVPPPRDMEFDLRGTAPGPAVLSPDGRMLAFTAANVDGENRLYLRRLDRRDAEPLPGTESAAYPFWSPDSRFVGFFDMSGGRLRKIAVAGGPPVTVCPAPNGKGGSWNAAGDIIFSPSAVSAIMRVSASGGEPAPATRLAPPHDSHRHPRFLPDGKHFVFTGRYGETAQRDNDIILASLDTTFAPRRIAASQGHAELSQGHLLTVREGVLMATPLGPDWSLIVERDKPLVDNVLVLFGAALAPFSTSTTGMLTYQTGTSVLSAAQLYWVDIASGGQQTLGEAGPLSHPVISPDARRAVVEMRNASNQGIDLWLVDLETGLRTRFTFAAGDEIRAVWSPDGQRVYYATRQEGAYSIIAQPVDGLAGATVLYESARAVYPSSVSPDGSHLLVDTMRDDDTFEMRRLSLDGSASEPVALAEQTSGGDGGGHGGGVYSPDGRWIAYHALSPAGWDIFVLPAGGGARKWQVTTVGAVYPRWSPDGTELWVSRFNGAQRVYQVDGSSDTFQIGSFREPITITSPDPSGSHRDLHPDGRRFLFSGSDAANELNVSPVLLVTDWQRGLVR
jgi:eukaryotic-like serine/threonine-protein kinase